MEAATLFFSPSSGTYNIGDAFAVSLYVSSPDQAENASQGTIHFPPDKLQVTSLGKSDSTYTIWVQEPFFSNAYGTVQFAGVVPNPGFVGQRGKVITVNFKVIGSGTAKINVAKGSVLANDGSGTQILTDVSDANFV